MNMYMAMEDYVDTFDIDFAAEVDALRLYQRVIMDNMTHAFTKNMAPHSLWTTWRRIHYGQHGEAPGEVRQRAGRAGRETRTQPSPRARYSSMGRPSPPVGHSMTDKGTTRGPSPLPW